MKSIPTATRQRTTYENFEAECPLCGAWNIFNRASDLGTFRPIAGLDVACQSAPCGQPFRIWCDRIDPAYKMLLYDCRSLLRRKQFMHCVLTTTQAYEVFFASFLRVRLLYLPFVVERDLEVFNGLSRDLYERVRRLPFDDLRNFFLRVVVDGARPANLIEARIFIESLPNRPSGVRRDEIEEKTTPPLRDHLLVLFGTKIHEVRNRVVHSDAARPSASVTSELVDEARVTLNSLNRTLGPLRDFEHYANAPRRSTD